jgi:hypothetical protein
MFMPWFVLWLATPANLLRCAFLKAEFILLKKSKETPKTLFGANKLTAFSAKKQGNHDIYD